MKVLLFNGSPERANGCTYLALAEIAKTLEADGIGTETLSVGSQPVWDCIGCNHCQSAGLCVFEEDVVTLGLRRLGRRMASFSVPQCTLPTPPATCCW